MKVSEILKNLPIEVTDVKIGDTWYSRGMGTQNWQDEDGNFIC
jgi:hypothetical protein